MEKEHHHHAIGLGCIERAPHGVPGGARVTECIPGGHLQHAGERQPGRRGDGRGAGEDGRERDGRRVRVTLGDPQRGQGYPYHAAVLAWLADFRDVLLGAR